MGDRTLAQYAELLRNDFSGFAHRAFLELYPARTYESNWHIEVLAEKLEAVRRGAVKRLIINAPPRSLKSYLGSVAFPAFLLGHNPSAEILCISYGEQLAHKLALPCRNLMLSPFYKALFKTRLSEDRRAIEDFETTQGGARRAVSWWGAVTGQGADFLIIDDPLKAEDANSEKNRSALNESYHTTVSSRINRDNCAIILIMQRLHDNDLTSFVQKGEHWDLVALPALSEEDETYKIHSIFGGRTITRLEGEALQPSRQSAASLKERRKAQGTRTFDAQYQQRPHGSEGAIIQRSWLVYYDENTRPAEYFAILQSWDTAIKPGENNSYNVCTTWGAFENRLYLLHVFREQMDYRKLKLSAINLAKEYKSTRILIEEQTLGSPLAHDLGQMGFPVQTVSVGSESKVERLYARANRFESGQVYLPRQASWLECYIEELTTFPNSDSSDQVDSTTLALTWDLSAVNFENTLRTMAILNTGIDPHEPKRKIKLRVINGGGVIQIRDGSGRPDIAIPQSGEIFEVDRDIGAGLLQNRWKDFVRVQE